jgi:hypothetical protein
MLRWAWVGACYNNWDFVDTNSYPVFLMFFTCTASDSMSLWVEEKLGWVAFWGKWCSGTWSRGPATLSVLFPYSCWGGLHQFVFGRAGQIFEVGWLTVRCNCSRCNWNAWTPTHGNVVQWWSLYCCHQWNIWGTVRCMKSLKTSVHALRLDIPLCCYIVIMQINFMLGWPCVMNVCIITNFMHSFILGLLN